MTELVHYEIERGIATITLDSPASRNALSTQLMSETTEHLMRAEADPDVRAVVLGHTGPTFCAGADLAESAAPRDPDQRDPAQRGPEQGASRMLELLRGIVELAKPVIAKIDGHVRAGGMGVVGACDIALAGPASTFAFTEVRLGLAPAIISLTTLPRLSERAAARCYLTGETFDAATAERIGLITEAAANVDAALAALLDQLRRCSPQGMAETKTLTTRRVRERFAAHADELQAQSARLFASEEAREGMQSFMQKRPPRWAVE